MAKTSFIATGDVFITHRVPERGGQAVFFRTLTKIEGGTHNRCYDMEASVLSTAVQVFCGTAVDLMNRSAWEQADYFCKNCLFCLDKIAIICIIIFVRM